MTSDLSGEASLRFATAFGTYVFSRAFSVKAACADCMAVDVLGRDVTIGEDGFIGSGGGARSGSELSHLESRAVSILPQPPKIVTYMGTNARPPSDEPEY